MDMRTSAKRKFKPVFQLPEQHKKKILVEVAEEHNRKSYYGMFESKGKNKYKTDSGEFAIQSRAKYVLSSSNMSVVN
jgi:hypothetical protein